MAAGGTYLARSTARPEAAEQTEKGPIGLSRKASFTAVKPAMSKIPTSSWFSRGKNTRTKDRPSEAPSQKSRDRPKAGAMSTESGSAAHSNTQPALEHGLGISASTSSSHVISTPRESRQRNVLRRKFALPDQRGRYTRTEISSTSSYEPTPPPRRYETASTPGRYSSSASGSILGLAVPTASTSSSFPPSSTLVNPDQATSSSRMAVYQNHKAPHISSTQNLPQPTPSFAQSSGSSTRRSESPGSMSRTSTPTSMSSYSPSISLPAKLPLKPRQSSPARSRPPVTRWKLQQDGAEVEARGLAAVRESITSSSSSSTVKGTERGDNNHSRQKVYRLSPPPPSPPLRGTSSRHAQTHTETVTQARASDQSYSHSQATHGSVVQNQRIHQHASRLDAFPQKLTSPPPRPSRDGTPQLDEYLAPSPVIHSNLSRVATTGHRRRESTEKDQPRSEGPGGSRTGLGRSPSNASTFSMKHSRLPSPSPSTVTSSIIRPPRPRLVETTKMTNRTRSEPSSSIEHLSKDPSPLSAGSAKSSSRFGLFSRKSRSPMEPSGAESADRAPKKGPVAGTGHEGYGKYAKRGRSGSMSTSASRGRSTSTSGTATSSIARTPISRKSSITTRDEPDIDDFLLERLAPVFISGGGMVDSRESGLDMHRTSSGESSPSVVTHDIRYTGRPPALMPSLSRDNKASAEMKDARPLRRESRTIPHEFGRRSDVVGTFDESDLGSSRTRPTLATRRSLHRLQLFKEAEPMKVPAPINTRTLIPSPMDSLDTVPTSALTADDTIFFADEVSEGREGNWLKPKTAGKRARSPNKWNFFQRALTSPKKSMEQRRYDDPNSMSQLPATISRLPQSRPVPYYAMLDASEQEDTGNTTDDNNIDRTMQNDLGVLPDSPEISRDEYSPSMEFKKSSMLLPSPPTFPAEFINPYDSPAQTKVDLGQPEVLPVNEPSSIEPSKPRVPRLQQIGRIPRVVSKRDRVHNPPPQSFSRPFARPSPQNNQAIFATLQEPDTQASDLPAHSLNTETIPSGPWSPKASAKSESAITAGEQVNEALQRKPQDEFLTFSPRKLSEISASSSSGGGSFAATMATTAIVPEPNTAFDEDEVWNEYNDFLDTVESPAPVPEGSRSQREHLRKLPRMTPAPLSIRKESQSAFSTKELAAAHGLPSPLAMSKLLAPRQSAETASSPMSFTDFFAGYADRNSVSATSKHPSYSSGSRYSTDSVPGYERSMKGKRHTQIMAEKTEDTSSSQSSLRFSALMTSRWLSFGRVLFSPAHDEIQSNRQDRILVLDGLGNDDWSFYCALTYPHATIYNLSPFQTSGSASAKKREAGAYDSPSNHRQIYHTSIAHPFPFPKGFFAAAVFRFPVADSETAYASAIAEFKRVLQPGGYLELSILDLDMVNMGNRTRRAVRTLKLSMQRADPDVSLKPNSDNTQKMLGRRGFENLKSCMVDVPVAGHISSSRAGSFDSKDMSLGDMLKDSSARGDESITKMVSKVGRWWYSRCYEMGVLPVEGSGMETSIWDDKQLLKECEKRETGLKLLICHAQKPMNTKRRTVSM